MLISIRNYLLNDLFGIVFTAVPEWFAAGAFGLVTVFTLLLRNVPALQSNLLYTIPIPMTSLYLTKHTFGTSVKKPKSNEQSQCSCLVSSLIL